MIIWYPMRKSRRRRRGELPSQGDLNRLVYSIVHPLIKGDARLPAMVLDTELHFMIEQDIESSVKKLIRYSLPGLIVDIAKSSDGSGPQGKRSRRRNRNRKA